MRALRKPLGKYQVKVEDWKSQWIIQSSNVFFTPRDWSTLAREKSHQSIYFIQHLVCQKELENETSHDKNVKNKYGKWTQHTTVAGVIAAVLSSSGPAAALSGIGIIAGFLCFVWLHINGIYSQEQKASYKYHEARENNFNRCGKALYNQQVVFKSNKRWLNLTLMLNSTWFWVKSNSVIRWKTSLGKKQMELTWRWRY